MNFPTNLKYLFLLLFFLLSLFASGVVDSQDGLQYLAVARNIYYKGEPTAPTYEYGTENDWKNIHMSTYVGADGKTYSPTGLGYSIAMLPSVILTDFFYKIYDISPPVHFPLESDWLIQLIASFTNVFFAVGVTIIIYLYLLKLGVKKINAIIISFLAIFSTNLFALSKHILPHMMFVFFLILCVYLLKAFFISKKQILIFLAGASFGILMLTYNSTFLLTIPFILLFYFFHLEPTFTFTHLKKIIFELFIFILGLLPFFALYIWFEKLRVAETTVGLSSVGGYYAQRFLGELPFSVFIEGLIGQLLSPGRSLFVYSPLLLVPVLFWHKLDKKIRPEVVSYIVLFVIYVCFYSTIYSIGRPEDQGVEGFWHGESSWGPRYLAPLIPFGIIIAGYIFNKIKTRGEILFISLIATIGFLIEFLGVILPYQIKFHELEKRFFINGTQYTMYVYSNFLPRYNPVFMMSKKLVKLVQNFPDTLDKGKYNVRFYDGIDFPFNVGKERWRPIEQTGYIRFIDKGKEIKNITLDLVNHPIATSSATSIIEFQLNREKIGKAEFLEISERKSVVLNMNEVKNYNEINELQIKVNYDNSSVWDDKSQILGMTGMYINGERVNLESLDVPYVSEFGPKMTGIRYRHWGGTNKDPWKFWEIHTQIYERVPDFWWIKPLYYWDMPKKEMLMAFIINLLLIFYFGLRVFKKTS